MGKTWYYYCSMSVFQSILEHKELWMPDVTRSNDRAEVKVFLDKLIELLEEKKKALSEQAEADKRTKKCYRFALDNMKNIRNNAFFWALCLSRLKDHLSHWEMYGDQGRGVCIGFDKELLETDVEKFATGPQTNKKKKLIHTKLVRYGEKKMQEELERQIDLFEKKVVNDRKKDYEEAVKSWSALAALEAAYYKHEGFKEEAEARLCYCRIAKDHQFQEIIPGSSLENVGFRVTENNCISYLKLPITPGTIKKIYIGPENVADEHTVRCMLAKNGFDVDMSVERSKVPYRGKR